MSKEITKCPKCGNTKLLTASGYGFFNADSEPYQSGIEGKAEIDEFEIDDILVLYCEKCERVVIIWMNYTDKDDME